MKLKISDNGRYICYDEGRPFFYLADTAWLMFDRLTREEADFYLENRAAKGFTVVMAMGIPEFNNLRQPNAYGDLQFEDCDPLRPNEKYYRHVDYILRKAGSLGMFVAFLPTWGDKVSQMWGMGPEIFNENNARQYGRWLGQRYEDAPVIWVMVGDRSPRGNEHIWRAMGRGLREGDGGKHLITAHCAEGPEKRMSNNFFNEEDWLDLNMVYGSQSHRLISGAYRNQPVRPAFNGEVAYENHAVLQDGDSIFGAKPDWDGSGKGICNHSLYDGVARCLTHEGRIEGYRAMLSGACGHTYGCHDIWQFYVPDKYRPVSWANTHWRKALHRDGSYQMGLMRRLFESRGWPHLVPDNELVTKGQEADDSYVQAARAADNSCILAYTPDGHDFSLNLGIMNGKSLKAHWFDTRQGCFIPASELLSYDEVAFKAPAQGISWDWLLVIDDAKREYPVESMEIVGVPKKFIEIEKLYLADNYFC